LERATSANISHVEDYPCLRKWIKLCDTGICTFRSNDKIFWTRNIQFSC